ncbi:MAG: type II toxin-antitoxin system RelE/ParE family toxin [Atopobiaceae bacterium]
MEIEYASKRLEKDLTSRRRMAKEYGHIQYRLENRLSEIWAAKSLADISFEPPPRRHRLEGNRAGLWGIDVSKNWRIVLEPRGKFDPSDLHTITHVRIVAIEDYH